MLKWIVFCAVCVCGLILYWIAYADGWNVGYDIAAKRHTDHHLGFKEGWNECRKHMLKNQLSNYNEVCAKDEEGKGNA